MSAVTRESLWARLRDAGIVTGDTPEPGDAPAPWAVRLMLGVAGWIGALFLLGFVGTGFAFIVRDATSSFIAGAIVCTGASAVFRLGTRNDFVAQLGLAVAFAGQALTGFALVKWFGGSITTAALALALQQALLFIVMPSFVHRVWSAWTGACAIAYALAHAGLHAFAPAAVTAVFVAVWLAEFDHPRRGAVLRTCGYGLALAAVQLAVMHGGLWTSWLHIHGARSAPGGAYSVWMGNLASGVVLVWAVLSLLRREGVALAEGPGRAALSGAALIALASLKAPGLGPAIAILFVGFANANRVLAGLGVLALLGYLSHYYYTLQATLLEKSALLVCTGAALLLLRLALHRWWPEEVAPHA